MNWLREKLRDWLGITLQGQKIEILDQTQSGHTTQIRDLTNGLHRVSVTDETVKRVDRIINDFQIGADVHPHRLGDSWAVFCIAGRMDYVRFVRLPDRDLRELQYFIKKFPANRDDKFMDLPYGIRKEFFEI